MLYMKRLLQAAFLFGIIWLTIKNYDAKVNLNLFGKQVDNSSVIIIIFFSILIGVLVATFFATLREFKNSREFRIVSRENKRMKKEIELAGKDILLLKNNIEKVTSEKEAFGSEVKALKEVLSYPEKGDNRILTGNVQKFLD